MQDPAVLACIAEAAKSDPEIALKVATHGWGHPPQALAVGHGLLDGQTGEISFRAVFEDGKAVLAASEDVPEGAGE